MLIKKIVPVQILNQYANVMLLQFYNIKCYDYSSARVLMEFYNEHKIPLCTRTFLINNLPINDDIRLNHGYGYDINQFPYGKEIFEMHSKIIFNEVKQRYSLIYYDDKYEIDPKLIFSFIKIPDYPKNYHISDEYWHHYK